MDFAAASNPSSADNLGLSGRGGDAPRHYSEVGPVFLMLVILVMLVPHNIFQRWMMKNNGDEFTACEVTNQLNHQHNAAAAQAQLDVRGEHSEHGESVAPTAL